MQAKLCAQSQSRRWVDNTGESSIESTWLYYLESRLCDSGETVIWQNEWETLEKCVKEKCPQVVMTTPFAGDGGIGHMP